MTYKKISIIILTLQVSALFGQKRDTPDSFSPGGIKAEYFWDNDRNAKAFKTKSKIIMDSIKNGYYAKKEYLKFEDKKLVSIKFKKGDSLVEIKLPNGTGIICTNKDTIRLVNGKLNGESYFYSYYPDPPLPQYGPFTLSKDLQKSVYVFRDNFLISLHNYRMGILIYESYYKNFDFIKESRAKTKNGMQYLDSVLNVYSRDGSLRSSTKWKNGRPIK